MTAKTGPRSRMCVCEKEKTREREGEKGMSESEREREGERDWRRLSRLEDWGPLANVRVWEREKEGESARVWQKGMRENIQLYVCNQVCIYKCMCTQTGDNSQDWAPLAYVIYVCIHTHVYIHIYKFIFKYISIQIVKSDPRPAHECALYICIYLHVIVNAYQGIYVCMYMHVHVHTWL